MRIKTPLTPQFEEAFEILVSLYNGRGRIKPLFNMDTIRKLKDVGLISILPGRSGGTFLGKSPENIRMIDIYQALEGELKFGMDSPAAQLNMFLHRSLSKATLSDFLPEPVQIKGFT
jgi:DNA-binding IscR family transcriptional regulator